MTRGEIRLAKKFPRTYSKKYGFIGRGGWLQAIITWGVLLLAGHFAFSFSGFWYFFMAAALVFLVAFRYWVSFRKRSFTLSEGISTWFYMFARDLAYPFFFAYFWATERAPRLE